MFLPRQALGKRSSVYGQRTYNHPLNRARLPPISAFLFVPFSITAMADRSLPTAEVLGGDLHNAIQQCRTLLVGAGLFLRCWRTSFACLLMQASVFVKMWCGFF